jgi:hypothetical protein
LKGELYIITTENVAPPPPKKFNIYGDWWYLLLNCHNEKIRTTANH